MADVYLEKKDPVQRAEHIFNKKKSPFPRKVNQLAQSDIPNSEPIPAFVLHEVNLRDQRQCMHMDSRGLRCKNKRWVAPHHVKHRKEGGANTAENLIILCSIHHRGEHTGNA